MSLEWTPYRIIIAVVMVITGSINTLSVKWANLLPSVNSIGAHVSFNHPFLQSTGMFMGELLCLFAFYISMCWTSFRSRQTDELISQKDAEEKKEAEEPLPPLKPFSWKNCFIMLPASLCDMTGTSVMYVGLTLTSASSYQMLRGSVIIFVGIASTLFLKKKLEWFRWLGMGVIVCGLVIVGAADFILGDSTKCWNNGTAEYLSEKVLGEEKSYKVYPLEPLCGVKGSSGGMNKELIGDVLVIVAQLIVSVQMVYEEKVISQYAIAPLQAIGWEGYFGFILMILLLLPFAYIPTGSQQWGHSPQKPFYLEDALDGLTMLYNNGLLLFSFLLTVVSIAFFNFAGISVTKELNATTRMVLDSVRTLVIWVFSISLGWEQFQYLQPIGFVVLISGMCLYNDILFRPLANKYILRKQDSS